VYADDHNTCLTYTPAHAWCSQHLLKCTPRSLPKMHMRSFMSAYAMVQKLFMPWKLLRTYLESCASIMQAVVCRPLLQPLLLSRPYPSPDAVLPRNPSKSTLAHDEVAAAVSHKHHSIDCVGAGLVQFVYGLHSRLATELTLYKNLYSPFFARVCYDRGSDMGFVL